MEAEWILLVLLYASLVHEVLQHLLQSPKKTTLTRPPNSRSVKLLSHPDILLAVMLRNLNFSRCRARAQGATTGRGLDGLWRRMQQAKHSSQSRGLQPDHVTQALSRARAYARKLEEKIVAAILADQS